MRLGTSWMVAIELSDPGHTCVEWTFKADDQGTSVEGFLTLQPAVDEIGDKEADPVENDTEFTCTGLLQHVL